MEKLLDATIEEYEAIEAAMQIYMKGSCISGAETAKAFHKNALVNAEPAQWLFDLIDELGEEKNAKARVEIIDVVGDMAMTRVSLENWHGKNYVDFHQLRKENGEWKIISKMFTEV